MSDETITISKIFDKCLIKDGYHSPGLEPVTFGNYSFDAGMLDNYEYKIRESFEGLKEKKNNNSPDATKLFFLMGALNKLSKLNISEEEFALTYNYKALYDNVNALLKYSDYSFEIVDLNTCFISNSQGEKVKMMITSKPGCFNIEGSFKYDFIFISIGCSEEDGLHGTLIIDNPKDDIKKAIYIDEKNNSVKAFITKFGSRTDIYLMEITPKVFRLKTMSRYFDNYEEEDYKQGDINRSFVVVNDDYEGRVSIEEISFNDEKEFEGGTFRRIKNKEYAKQFVEQELKKRPNRESEEENEEYEEMINSLTENSLFPDYDENVQALVNNERVIELFNVIIDQIEDSIPCLKEYIFNTLPTIKAYAIGEYSVTDEADPIFDRIYNPDCDFGQSTLFEGYQKEQ